MSKILVPRQKTILLEMHKTDEFNLLLEDTDAAKVGRGSWVVIAVGPEVKDVKVGDSIITKTGQMAQVKHEGKDVAFTDEELVSIIVREV